MIILRSELVESTRKSDGIKKTTINITLIIVSSMMWGLSLVTKDHDLSLINLIRIYY